MTDHDRAAEASRAIEPLLPATLDPEARDFALWVHTGGGLIAEACRITGTATERDAYRTLIGAARALVAGSRAAAEADLGIGTIPREEAGRLPKDAEEALEALSALTADAWGPFGAYTACRAFVAGLLGRTRAYVVEPVEAMLDVPAIRQTALAERMAALDTALAAVLALVNAPEEN